MMRCSDLSGTKISAATMGLQAHGELFGRQGNIWIEKKSQPNIMAVQAISTQRLCGRKMQNSVEKCFNSIRHDLHKRLRLGFESGRPHLIRATLNEEQRPVRKSWSPSNNSYAPPRLGIVRQQELPPLASSIAILKNRHQQGDRIESNVLIDILKRCSKQKDLIAAREVHDLIILSGMEKDRYVATTLVSVYIKCGRLQNAHRVFDGLLRTHRTIITWNVMIGAYAKCGCGKEAYRLFNQMIQEGFRPNAITYMSILNASASSGALDWVKEVHSHARKAGLESDLRVASALVRMYAKSGSIDDARLVFDRMKKRDTITWNIMIGAYAENGCGTEAYQLFLQMKTDGFVPTAMTYMSILNASASSGALEWVKQIHDHVRKAGLESDLNVGNAIVHMYAKSGSIEDARLIFNRMEKRDVITWTSMIGAYAESGSGMEAYGLFFQMNREGVTPNAMTYMNVLSTSASEGALEWVKEVHGHACKAGLETDLRVASSLVRMYAKSGSIDEARLVFDRMEKHDVITWTVMIKACAENACGEEAYRLFLEMKGEGFIPDATTFLSILNSSANGRALEWVKEVHSHVVEAGLESDLRVGNFLIHLFAKSGSIDDARGVFDRMKNRDTVTWNVMIGGLALHGCGDEALKCFKEMIADCGKPDETSFVAVLSACSHAGLVDEGRRIFSTMKKDYGIEPDVVHYNCMVDILGRAGRLEEAKLLIGNMPLEPDAVTWKALLGACRTYSSVELGEFAAKEVLKLDPKDASAYVQLSNIYAASGEWEKVSSVRRLMQGRRVRKEPGRSWIEVDNKIHEFVKGDTSHPEAKAIYSELTKLTLQLKSKGYVPDTKLVLHNIDEEEKELAICSHSERLAIAYGLLHVSRDEPIRVEKNLRACSDCHAATKLISEVTGREIIVRDANRFHHFKDGVCSCGDYW